MPFVKAVCLSLRPNQWIKNLFIFSGILFSRNIFHVSLLERAIEAFFVYCLLSGAVYILNDLADYDLDKGHPVKSKRPIASGMLGIQAARITFGLIAALALLWAWVIGLAFFFLSLLYLVLQLCYSFFLKRQVIIDIFSIALGFVLRVVAGAVAINVEISSWLIICTLLLALFLGMGKRRHELETFAGRSEQHRQVLQEYSLDLLDQMISVVTASTVVSYALYTMAPETVARFGTKNLIFTVPFVLYGVFRYLYLIHKKGEGGNPETVLVSDVPLLINIFLWALTAGLIIYL